MKEKLLVNTHLRVSEDMIREVRALAELEHRSIQDQYRYLLSIALQLVRGKVKANGEGNGRTVTHDDANQFLPAPPIAANGGAVTRERKRA